MSRLLTVSNRLPVTVVSEGQAPRLVPSAGGLATGIRGLHEGSGGIWIGWPGDMSSLGAVERAALAPEFAARHAVPIELTADEVVRYYEGFSNEVLWPLFHYRLDQMPLHVRDWEVYAAVNERFADVVAAHHRPGDLVWVHDYQLLLVPALLRRRLPDARIGFFLHIPFPSSEVFRTVPHRERLLEGLLGADLIGFHTAAYMRHFGSALLRTLGLAADVDRVRVGGREITLGVFPMGVDAAHFSALARSPEVAAAVQTLRGGTDQPALFVAIDRLDYTKGIPRRLLAFEQLLQSAPSLREHVRLIQIAVPSRTKIDAYQDFRRDVEQLVGRVNGAFATPRHTPVSYVFRSVSQVELVALYRAADVMLVTPVRDGMNLVAKEFVAAREDEGGVLVLSEFAGVASEFAEALQVNPYDVGHAAEVYRRALDLPADERRARMRGLRRRVFTYDVHHWARSFVAALEAASARPRGAFPRPEDVVRRLRGAAALVLVLDYDGTLVPFSSAPDLAAPDEALLSLLAAAGRRPGTHVHVVSGRAPEMLERWFGALPVTLHAEDGVWSRPAGGAWIAHATPRIDWMARVLPILRQVAERTPGSLIEEKTASLAWHYRMVEPEFGTRQANELRLHLSELLSNAPLEIVSGEYVIEVRPHGAGKGALTAALVSERPRDATVVALGDGVADEDVFAALPPDGVAVHVGPSPSRADVRLADVDAVRRFLAALVAVGDQT